MIRKLVHMGYFIKSTDYHRVRRCMLYVRDKYAIGLPAQFSAMISSAWEYGASFEDFYDFRLFAEGIEEKQWATTVDAHYFHKRMNAQDKRYIFRNKYEFLVKFHNFAKRAFFNIDLCPRSELESWLKAQAQFVAKPVYGEVGRGIELVRCDRFSSPELIIQYLKRRGLLLVEEEIQQHDYLHRLNPASVNTIRVVAVLQKDNVQIIGSVLRMSRGSFVDNFSAGGIAAPIDSKTGDIIGPAVSTMPDEEKYERHPLTGERIVGFRVPYWPEVLEMIEEVAHVVPEVRTVGWDLAISNEGPILVEGNDNWGKTTMQIPFGRGIRDVLRTASI